MSQTGENLKGERLSFYELFHSKGAHIEIPIIQRDYAQGRESSLEVREGFLETLWRHLENRETIDLDFVYGTREADGDPDTYRFVPLDGQQRLTTLFLLHWYLANKDNRFGFFQQALISEERSRFTYETRTSSAEFCDALVKHPIDLNALLPARPGLRNSLSRTLKNSSWYYLSWEADPTIKAMLTMLDAIHERFKDTAGLFDRLANVVEPVVTFQFLDLERFKLTDDLYIKMNARGKPLTPFESFKARFEERIGKTRDVQDPQYTLYFNGTPKKVGASEYFSHRIDTAWADLFWSFHDEKGLYDSRLMNFIRVLATNHYAVTADTARGAQDKVTQDINLLRAKEKAISFPKYEAMRCFDEAFISQLIGTLDLLCGKEHAFRVYLTDPFYYDERQVFAQALENALGYTQSIQLYAFYQYLIRHKGDCAGLWDWMRVVHNLSENRPYNEAAEFQASLKSVQSLLPESHRILEYLADEANPVGGFLTLQVQEERLKAQLLLKDSAWRALIIEAEQHGYFRGQVGFLLEFAGVQDYYEAHKGCGWSGEENATFFDLFTAYKDKAFAVFNDRGVNDYGQFRWERALLTKGNYLMVAGHNRSFLKNEDRDLSWKRLLRDDNGGRREYVKALFDDQHFDGNYVQGSLQMIIDSSGVSDWRFCIIRNPETISYCRQRMIRWQSNEDVVLLGQSQLNHYHAELYSYSFYHNYIKGKVAGFAPFKDAYYAEVKSGEEDPCAVVHNWEYKGQKYSLEVYYSSYKKAYELFFYEKSNNAFLPQVEDALLQNGWTLSGTSYTLDIVDEKDVVTKLEASCQCFAVI